MTPENQTEKTGTPNRIYLGADPDDKLKETFEKFFDQNIIDSTKTLNEIARTFVQVFTIAFTVIVGFRTNIFHQSTTITIIGIFSMISWVFAIVFALMAIFPTEENIIRKYSSIRPFYDKMIKIKTDWLCKSTIAFFIAIALMILDALCQCK